MLTRRTFFATATAALAAPSQPATPVNFDVPANACDCHTHIIGDPAKFPFSPARAYTPEIALPAAMRELHRALHMRRVVIVTPSVYGADNSASLYGMKARGRDARGVAVIDERATQRDLRALRSAGFRGMRLNLATAGVTDIAIARRRLTTAIAQAKSIGWHIQMFTSLPVIAGIRDLVQDSAVPVVFDHFGGADASLGLEQPGFRDLLQLLRSGKAWVKISGAYRASGRAPDYPDVAPFARALIEANPAHVVWGSDWPHPNTVPAPGKTAADLTPLFQIDDGCLLNQLPVWAPDAATRRAILVDNPSRLYEF